MLQHHNDKIPNQHIPDTNHYIVACAYLYLPLVQVISIYISPSISDTHPSSSYLRHPLPLLHLSDTQSLLPISQIPTPPPPPSSLHIHLLCSTPPPPTARQIYGTFAPPAMYNVSDLHTPRHQNVSTIL